MRAPNDMLSIRNLSHQLFPKEGSFFMDAYKQACVNPYGYLMLNLHANSNNILRLRTNIFPGEESIVFTPKNG
jgi:hypothetical protein